MYSLQCNCIENQFTVYRKPDYSTSIQKTSLQYNDKECTGTDITHQINLSCTIMEYHTDGTLHSTGNVQGQTQRLISTLFKDTHSDKATLWIIELLTLQLKRK